MLSAGRRVRRPTVSGDNVHVWGNELRIFGKTSKRVRYSRFRAFM